MRFRRRYLALCWLAGTLSGGASASAELGSSGPVQPTVPPQVAYDFAVTTRGINVGTAMYHAIFGRVTVACLDDGAVAIVGRDAKNVVMYEATTRTPPTADLALRPYSRAFSEIRRIAWNVCAPSRAVAHGENRTVEQKGAFALGGFTFPDEIKIQDQLGSVGCEAAAADKLGRAAPCTSKALTQPFVSTLTRRAGR